jgi:hypothetical protein
MNAIPEFLPAKKRAKALIGLTAEKRGLTDARKARGRLHPGKKRGRLHPGKKMSVGQGERADRASM